MISDLFHKNIWRISKSLFLHEKIVVDEKFNAKNFNDECSLRIYVRTPIRRKRDLKRKRLRVRERENIEISQNERRELLSSSHRQRDCIECLTGQNSSRSREWPILMICHYKSNNSSSINNNTKCKNYSQNNVKLLR